MYEMKPEYYTGIAQIDEEHKKLFIVTFHQIVFYSLCFGRSWLLIHLMLKLIAVGVALGGLAARFNTSHVKVNLTNNIIKQHDPVSFNTSHVKVNQDDVITFEELGVFQYIPC